VTPVEGDGETEEPMRHCLANRPPTQRARPDPSYLR